MNDIPSDMPFGHRWQSTRRYVPALVFCVVALAIPWASGLRSPITHFNFGPSDSGYLDGFEPIWEIDQDGVATHWSSYQSAVRLPVRLASEAELTYRFQRIYGETAMVRVLVNGVEVDRFEARGGAWVERSARVLESVAARSPLRIELLADSHEGHDRGLRWDWLRVTSSSGFAQPTPRTVIASGLVILSLLLSLHYLGAEPKTTNVAAAVSCVLMAGYGGVAGLFALSHWLDAALPAILIAALAAVGFRRGSRAALPVAGLLWALFFVGLLLRTMGVLHPLFYHPDLRAHADMARIVGEVGLHFWLEPSRYIADQGVWTAAAVGRSYAFPFSPVFHAPFALAESMLFPGALEAAGLVRTMHWMKLVACVLSSLEIVLIYRMAQRWISPSVGLWCAAITAIAPPSLSRLSFVFFAAVFAHLLDILVITRLSRLNPDQPISARHWAATAGVLLVALASYPGSLIHFGLFIPVLGVLGWLWGIGPHHRTQMGSMLLVAAATATMTMLTVYHEFAWVFASDILPRALRGEEQGGSISLLAIGRLALDRLGAFYHPLEAALIVVGGALFAQMRSLPRWGRLLAIAWLVSFVLELVLRSAMPQLFGKVKEILWIMPLFAIFVGIALHEARERFGKLSALAIYALLAIVNVRFFVLQITERFDLAR